MILSSLSLPYFFTFKGVRFIKILAIDQSTVKSGYAIFDNDSLTKYSMIDLHKEKDKSLKFTKMCSEIHKLIQSCDIDSVVFEDTSLQSNVSTLKLLAQLQGIIICSCQVKEIPYIIYKPSEWRKINHFKQGSGIKRKELKQQSKDLVAEKYNIKVNDDISDAICIGLAYIKQKENDLNE